MALFPLVEDYLNNAKQIDENFMKKAIKIFEQTFPGAVYDYEALFFDCIAFSDFEKNNLVKCFWNTFGSISGLRTIPISKFNTARHNAYQPFELLILNNKQHIPGITLECQTDSLYVNKGKKCIVIKTDKIENVSKALEFLKRQKYLTKSFLYKL
jgi:hypothetical protein